MISVAAMLPACKKNGSSSPKQVLISKVIYDGKLESEFIYNSDGQLTEEKYYHEENGIWQLTNHFKHFFDANGNPKEILAYNMPENILSGKYVFTVNDRGQILRNSIYDMSGADSGSLNFHVDHEYNASGRLISKTWKDENENVETVVKLNLYPNGNLRTSETFYEFGTPEKVWGSSYSSVDSTLPASFYNIKAFPVNYYYPYLLGQTIRNFSYEDGAVSTETRLEFSARIYNKKGFVTEQKIITKNIKPAGPDEVHTIKFEYVEF